MAGDTNRSSSAWQGMDSWMIWSSLIIWLSDYLIYCPLKISCHTFPVTIIYKAQLGQYLSHTKLHCHAWNPAGLSKQEKPPSLLPSIEVWWRSDDFLPHFGSLCFNIFKAFKLWTDLNCVILNTTLNVHHLHIQVTLRFGGGAYICNLSKSRGCGSRSWAPFEYQCSEAKSDAKLSNWLDALENQASLFHVEVWVWYFSLRHIEYDMSTHAPILCRLCTTLERLNDMQRFCSTMLYTSDVYMWMGLQKCLHCNFALLCLWGAYQWLGRTTGAHSFSYVTRDSELPCSYGLVDQAWDMCNGKDAKAILLA